MTSLVSYLECLNSVIAGGTSMIDVVSSFVNGTSRETSKSEDELYDSIVSRKQRKCFMQLEILKHFHKWQIEKICNKNY